MATPKKEWGSYEQWNTRGYYVRKGEHSKLRSREGVPLFSSEQVNVKFFGYSGDEYESSGGGFYEDLSFEDTQRMGFWG